MISRFLSQFPGAIVISCAPLYAGQITQFFDNVQIVLAINISQATKVIHYVSYFGHSTPGTGQGNSSSRGKEFADVKPVFLGGCNTVPSSYSIFTI